MTVLVLNFIPGAVGSSRVTYGSALLTDKVKGTVHQMRELRTSFPGALPRFLWQPQYPLKAARPHPKECLVLSLGIQSLPTDNHSHRSALGRLRASRIFTVSFQKTAASSCKEIPSPLVLQQPPKPGDAVQVSDPTHLSSTW